MTLPRCHQYFPFIEFFFPAAHALPNFACINSRSYPMIPLPHPYEKKSDVVCVHVSSMPKLLSIAHQQVWSVLSCFISVLTPFVLIPSCRAQRTPLSIYKDTNVDVMLGHQPGKSKTDLNPWSTLGARAERNKENNAIPSKWTTYKVGRRSYLSKNFHYRVNFHHATFSHIFCK